MFAAQSEVMECICTRLIALLGQIIDTVMSLVSADVVYRNSFISQNSVAYYLHLKFVQCSAMVDVFDYGMHVKRRNYGELFYTVTFNHLIELSIEKYLPKINKFNLGVRIISMLCISSMTCYWGILLWDSKSMEQWIGTDKQKLHLLWILGFTTSQAYILGLSKSPGMLFTRLEEINFKEGFNIHYHFHFISMRVGLDFELIYAPFSLCLLRVFLLPVVLLDLGHQHQALLQVSTYWEKNWPKCR